MLSWKQIKLTLYFMLPSIMLGVLAGSYPGYQLYRYTWENAEFCTKCHVHDYATIGWEQSPHGNITTCHDCHHQRLRDYMREMIVMIKDRPQFPKDLHHTPYVKKELCAACHVSNAADKSTITGPFAFEEVEKIPKVDLSHLHRIHLGKETKLKLLSHHELSDEERDVAKLKAPTRLNQEQGDQRSITCTDCHGGPQNRSHQFSAVDSACLRCHDSNNHNTNNHIAKNNDSNLLLKSSESNKELKSVDTKVIKEVGCRQCHFQDFLIPFDKKIKTK